ncbi:hypothetical protein OC844_003153 [Tilletia horrida]|nr:hypothetical protein OC844_003153 [Tilletia horrida]
MTSTTSASTQEARSLVLALLGSLVSWQGICALLSAWCLYTLFFHPLADLPGPLSARLGLPWRFYHALRRDYAWALKAAHDRHGPVVRLGVGHVSFASPAAAATIYAHASKDKPIFAKSVFYKSFWVFRDRGSLFSEIDPHQHVAWRRSVAPAYSMKTLTDLEDCLEAPVNLLKSRLESEIGEEANATATVNFSQIAHFAAMDMVGELAFGSDFGLLRAGADPDRFLTGVTNLSQLGGAAGCLPRIGGRPLVKLLAYLRAEPGREVIDAATRGRVQRRVDELRKGGEVRPDMLAKFMAAKHPFTGEPLTFAQTLFMASSVISAGSDTTAVALSATIEALVRHPEAYARAQAEVDEAFARGTMTEPIRYADGVKLEFLQACLKESIRLHTPVAMELARLVPAGGAIIDGRFYKAGTTVGVSPFVLHRQPAAYGADAAEWKPDRWCGCDEETRRALERNNLVFGGGSRVCIGKTISMMELSKILPMLLRHFHFLPIHASAREPGYQGRSVEGVISKDEPWMTESSWFLHVSNLHLRMSRRHV